MSYTATQDSQDKLFEKLIKINVTELIKAVKN